MKTEQKIEAIHLTLGTLICWLVQGQGGISPHEAEILLKKLNGEKAVLYSL